MQNQSRRIGALLAATMLATAVLTAGCQPQRPVRPVETPPPPIVEEALQRSQEVRSTIVGGEAPVPQRPDSLDPVGAQPGEDAFRIHQCLGAAERDHPHLRRVSDFRCHDGGGA